MVFRKNRVVPVVIFITCLIIVALAARWAIRPISGREAPVHFSLTTDTDTRTLTAFSGETAVGELAIKPLPEPAADGSLVYQVQGPQGAVLGTFSYIPWQGKNPLYLQLSGGSVILGNSSIYTIRDHRLHSLTEGTGLGQAGDYSVDGSKLALIGKNGQQGDTEIFIKDLETGSFTPVDSFKYPEYMGDQQAYLCWNAGKLYYDYWTGDKPEVKVYDPVSSQSAVFKDNAMDPQVSPDGRYLALFASDSPVVKTGARIGLELLDLASNRVIGLEGSNRVFWSPGYITVWDGDKLQLHIYSLNSGAKIKDLPADSPVADLAIDNGVLKGTAYHFENRQITYQQFQADIATKNTIGLSSSTTP